MNGYGPRRCGLLLADRLSGSSRAQARVVRMALGVALAAALGCAQSAAADEEPLWEIGVAAGYIDTPQYMGSDESYSLPLAIPYIIYRGDLLDIDREGARGWLFTGRRISLDLGFSFGLPVDNDNKARRGMPDIRLTGQVGPRLNVDLTAPDAPTAYSLHFPVRYTFDTAGKGLGWVAEPSLKVERKHLGDDGRWSARADVGFLYAGRRFNAYYYDVDAPYVTPQRPSYASDSGLHSAFLHLSTEYAWDERLTLGAFARYRTLSPGVIDDSPLVKDPDYVTVGVGFAWSLWESERRVSR